jgi:baseplate J-like protein
MATTQKDRLAKLLDPSNTTFNGIDFVEILHYDEKTLRVHFLNTVAMPATVTKVKITGGETIPTVDTTPINDANDWALDPEGRPLLTLRVAAPGDFSFYTLTLTSPALDPFYDHVTFSFKALCHSDLDCETSPAPCPAAEGDPPPIDYLAKDFNSFRKALLDFSALRYPEWQERSEADFGMMFLESLSSLGDDLSYTQDRVAAEATIETATQRRSLVRHARLVDYEPKPATSSRVTLQFDVRSGPIPSGLLVSSLGPDGVAIEFETGNGLINPETGTLDRTTFPVSPAWNSDRIAPYYWDDSQRCLPAGSTGMWVVGHGFQFQAGQKLLIDTKASTSADPPIRQIVELVSATEETDPLYSQDVTHIVWRDQDKLIAEHDLTPPRTALAGNLVPATQGRRYTDDFAVEPIAPFPMVPALQRTGPNSTPDSPTPQYLHPLNNAPLAWLNQDALDSEPLPEIVMTEQPSLQVSSPVEWRWRRSLLDADVFEAAFTVDPARFRRIARNSDGTFFWDYDADDGETLRFGDGVFGAIPEPGSSFHVTYRVGLGAAGNVAADSITKVDPSVSSLVAHVTNPFAAVGGADRETDEQVRRLAPQKFRALQFRAVRPEDYVKAAKRLLWVSQAGTVFRWTGSWLTVFTTADPRASEQMSIDEHLELINLLNRYRLAGYESYTPSPRFVSLDLVVTLCARPDAFRADAEVAVLAALGTGTFPDGKLQYFHPERFTFGTPLERSALEAAVQEAAGVAGVISVQYRRRGVTAGFVDMPDRIAVAPDQIIRVDNDPSQPERGSLKVLVGGGK